MNDAISNVQKAEVGRSNLLVPPTKFFSLTLHILRSEKRPFLGKKPEVLGVKVPLARE